MIKMKTLQLKTENQNLKYEINHFKNKKITILSNSSWKIL